MTLATIGIGYVAIGVAVAIAIGVARGAPSRGDVVLLVAMWPLWGPLALAHADLDPREHQLLRALAAARASPLASLLPDAESARVLGSRLRDAGQRLIDLDRLLARPEFDVAAVQLHARELSERGAAAAAATAGLRVRTLDQLVTLRERYRGELDEVRELIAQLVAQAELVRLQPAISNGSSELVHELVARVEGLDDLFAHQRAIEREEYATRDGRCGGI